MNNVYLGLGSNLGDRENRLGNAKELLQEKAGKILLTSSIYETQPWKMEDAKLFLNQVILLETFLSAFDLMNILINIEISMGRTREKKEGYESRIIDIDILFYNRDILHFESLVIPHPQIAYRRFVLEPLNEIAADYIHPDLKKPVKFLLAECIDKGTIAKYVLK